MTKRRSRYTQMLGRFLRPLPGVVDGLETPDQRKAAIAKSDKPVAYVIDFVGVCGKHSLITVTDIRGAKYEPDVVERAKRKINESPGQPVDVKGALEEARKELEEEAARDEAERIRIRVGAKYVIGKKINPFAICASVPERERGWEKNQPIPAGWKAWLTRQKGWKEEMTFAEARHIVSWMKKRKEANLCTLSQCNMLNMRRLPWQTIPFDVAHEWIQATSDNGWSVPSDVYRSAAGYRKREVALAAEGKLEFAPWVDGAKKPEKRR